MTRTIPKGDCDYCIESKNVVLYQMLSGGLGCESCRDKEVAVQAQVTAAEKFIADSRQQDATIQIEANIWNAATESFVALRDVIQDNPSIADNQKRIALINEAIVRIQQCNKAISETERTLKTQKNERGAWIKQTNEMVAQLRAEDRAKYKNFDGTYEPKVTIEKVKKAAKSSRPSTSAASSTSSGPSYKKVKEACDAAGIADTTTIRRFMLSKNMTLEQAIARYNEIMGK